MSVYCSYCGQRGHNRLGCPKRRKDALADPESYTGRQWHREQEKRKERMKARKCSYCDGDERGGKRYHNRRGCKLRKADMAEEVEKRNEYREKFLHRMKQHGLGVGSIVRVPMKGDALEYGVNFMVDKINWGDISHRLKDERGSGIYLTSREKEPLRGRVVSHNVPESEVDYWMQGWLRPMATNSISIMSLDLGDLTPWMQPKNEAVNLNYQAYPRELASMKVVGPIDPSKVDKTVPTDFFSKKLDKSEEERFGFDEGFRPQRFRDKDDG